MCVCPANSKSGLEQSLELESEQQQGKRVFDYTNWTNYTVCVTHTVCDLNNR